MAEESLGPVFEIELAQALSLTVLLFVLPPAVTVVEGLRYSA